MSFKDLVIDTRKIPVGQGKTVELRPLNTTDVICLINEFEEITALLFEGVDFKNMDMTAKELIARAPAIAYLAIAMAADEPESAEMVSKLPLPVQIDLLRNLYDMTFPEGKEDIKKLQDAIFLQKKK